MERDIYWDSLKFALISLVVYGHVVAGYMNISQFNMAMFNFIYLFHMPLFVFVSGRFSHIHDRDRYKKNIFKLFETYLVFQVLLSIVDLVFGEKLSWKILTTPNWILWYLIALIFWRLLIYWIPDRYLQKRKYMIIASLSMSLLAGFIPISSSFAVQRTLAFLPFFILGYYSVGYDYQKLLKSIPRLLAYAILGLSFIGLYCINDDLSYIHNARLPYWTDNNTQTLLRCGERGLFLLTAIILSIMVIRIIPSNKTIAQWGKRTMYIFLYHAFAIFLLNVLIWKGFLPDNEVALILYAISIIAVLLVLSHVKIFTILLNPISTLLGHYKKCKS